MVRTSTVNSSTTNDCFAFPSLCKLNKQVQVCPFRKLRCAYIVYISPKALSLLESGYAAIMLFCPFERSTALRSSRAKVYLSQRRPVVLRFIYLQYLFYPVTYRPSVSTKEPPTTLRYSVVIPLHPTRGALHCVLHQGLTHAELI